MTKNEKIFILVSFILASFSGAVIFVLDTFFKVDLSWGVQASPFLSPFKIFHYFSTPLLLLGIGMIFKNHIAIKIKNYAVQKRKITGTILLTGLVFLVFTGQSLLFITGEVILPIMKYIHLGLGVLCGLVLIKHLS